MDQTHKMPANGYHEGRIESSEYVERSCNYKPEMLTTAPSTNMNQRRPDSPFPTVADMINNMPPRSANWDADAAFETETIYYLDSPSPSEASIESDYDMISDVDVPYRKSKSAEDVDLATQEPTTTDTNLKTTTRKKPKSTFERGRPLCEANMFGPLDWGLELMGGSPEAETEPEATEYEPDTLSNPRRSIIEEVSYDGIVVYTIRRDIDERVHWPGTPA